MIIMCDNHSSTIMNFNPFFFGDDLKNFKDHWKNDSKGRFFGVDSCIAEIVRKMNTEQKINTLSSCCFHGKPIPEDEGQISIDSHSVCNAIKCGYDVRIKHVLWDELDDAEYEKELYDIRIKTC